MALFGILKQLADEGIAIIAAAGNGGTTECFWPAAMATDRNLLVRVTSVGATNPTGGRVAVFSNAGPWVSTYECGVAVVGTMPTTLEGSARGDVAVAAGPHRARSTPDPDCYGTGFGVWSGTSFSAPCAAGRVASLLSREASPTDPAARAKRASAAVAKVVGAGG